MIPRGRRGRAPAAPRAPCGSGLGLGAPPLVVRSSRALPSAVDLFMYAHECVMMRQNAFECICMHIV
jgi:hypothetical protein